MAEVITVPKEMGRMLTVGQLLRVKEIADGIVLEPLAEPHYVKPGIYIGSNWEGLSFEIPPDRVLQFLLTLGRALRPAEIRLYFEWDGSEEKLVTDMKNYQQAIASVGDGYLHHSFMAEFDQHTLFSGGGGCFSLQATLPPERLREIAQAIMDELGIAHQLDRDDFQVAVVNGHLEVYR